MACGDFNTAAEFLRQGQFFDGIYCPYFDVLGIAAPLLLFGAIGIAIYVHSDSVVLPLTLGLILSGVVVTQLPSVAAQFVGAVVILAIAVAGYLFVINRGPAR